MPIGHVRKPLDWIRRRLAEIQNVSQEGQSHLAYWLDDLAGLVSDDPSKQALAQTAVFAYSQVVRYEEALLKAAAGSKQEEKLSNALLRWNKQAAFALRELNVRRNRDSRRMPGGRKQVFTAAAPGEDTRSTDGPMENEAA